MFEQKDYIMRMVRQFTVAIARIMGLKAENKIEESQKVINDTLKYFTDLNIDILEALPYEILIHKVSGGRQIHSQKCLMLSELLTQQADIYEISGDMSRARNLYQKSLNITINALLNASSTLLEQNQNKVEELIEKMGRHDFSNESNLLLFKYFENMKYYSKAEDLLFNMIDSNKETNDILDMGIAFYERLINIDQPELVEGNLPKDEVLEGLATLKGFRN